MIDVVSGQGVRYLYISGDVLYVMLTHNTEYMSKLIWRVSWLGYPMSSVTPPLAGYSGRRPPGM